MSNTVKEEIKFKRSPKLTNLPMYVFAELDVFKAEAKANGLDIIDLGIGSPDMAAAKPVIEAAAKSMAEDPCNNYPPFKGTPRFKKAVSTWVKNRYNIDIDPETEVLPLMGSKEGIFHFIMAYTDPGDVNIVPDPYYPVHSRASWLCGADVHHVPLKAENDFLIDLDAIPEDISRKAKIIIVNYPNNPTSAIAPISFYEKLVAYCKKYHTILLSDLAYGEICFDGYRPPSIFNVEGAKDVAIEFHSCSKSFNMAGYRTAFAIGNADLIDGLFSLKTNCDYGTPVFLQEAAAAAFEMDKSYLENTTKAYQERRDIVVEGFRDMGWDAEKPKASMYVWLRVPEGYDSKTWIKYVLDKTGVCLTPGIAFGEHSDDYFRISLVQSAETFKEAIKRLKNNNIRYK